MKRVILKIEWDNEKLTPELMIKGIKWYLKDLNFKHTVEKINIKEMTPSDKVIQLLKDCKWPITLVHQGDHSELELLNRIDKTLNEFCKQPQLIGKLKDNETTI